MGQQDGRNEAFTAGAYRGGEVCRDKRSWPQQLLAILIPLLTIPNVNSWLLLKCVLPNSSYLLISFC